MIRCTTPRPTAQRLSACRGGPDVHCDYRLAAGIPFAFGLEEINPNDLGTVVASVP